MARGKTTEFITLDGANIAAIRWILLCILWHSLPAEASDNWLKEQMALAGATAAEIVQLSGE